MTVINLSLGGPRNLLVEAALQRTMQQGIVVVAAAGNGGADAMPVYPAAQPGVIAITAVDANLKPYPRANRGDYIAYAAPGVDVWVATPGGTGEDLWREGHRASGCRRQRNVLCGAVRHSRDRGKRMDRSGK